MFTVNKHTDWEVHMNISLILSGRVAFSTVLGSMLSTIVYVSGSRAVVMTVRALLCY